MQLVFFLLQSLFHSFTLCLQLSQSFPLLSVLQCHLLLDNFQVVYLQCQFLFLLHGESVLLCLCRQLFIVSLQLFVYALDVRIQLLFFQSKLLLHLLCLRQKLVALVDFAVEVHNDLAVTRLCIDLLLFQILHDFFQPIDHISFYLCLLQILFQLHYFSLERLHFFTRLRQLHLRVLQLIVYVGFYRFFLLKEQISSSQGLFCLLQLRASKLDLIFEPTRFLSMHLMELINELSMVFFRNQHSLF